MKKIVYASLFATLLSTAVTAQTVPLHEQPNATSKVTGTAELSAGIIPIYTPQKSEWIKVADPRNGNVGWIKSSDITHAKGGSSVVFSQKIISNGNQQGYHVIQFGSGVAPTLTSPSMSKEQNDYMDAFVKKMQYEQQGMQNSFQNLMRDMNNFFRYQVKMWQEMSQPTPATKKAVPVKTTTEVSKPKP